MARFSRKDIFFKDGDMAVFGDAQDSRLYWDNAQNQLTLTSTISGVYPTLDPHLATKQYVDDQITSEVFWDRTGNTIYPVTSSDIVSLGTVVTGTASLNVHEQAYIHELTGGTSQLILDSAMLSEGGESYISFKDDGDIVGVFRAGASELEFTAYSNQNRDMIIQTSADSGGTNDTYLRTGDASGGDSGNVYISTGTAGGIKGSVYVQSELDMSSNTIVNLPNPTTYSGAANKGYVDNAVSTLSGSILTDVEYIDFDTTVSGLEHVEGRIHWNDDEGTLEIDMPGGEVKLQIGHEELHRVRNKESTTILNGEAVYVSGSTGDRAEVKRATASDPDKSYVLGLATEDIPANQSGYVAAAGTVRDINTNGMAHGLPVWLSTVSGGYTQTMPSSPNMHVFLGYVVRAHATEGSLAIRPTVVPRLSMLSDVYNGNEFNENDTVLWDNTNQRFQITTLSGVLTKDDIILREDKVLTDFINLTAAGRVYGMTIVSGTNAGTAAITSGIMAIRESNSSTSNLQCYDISAQDNISLTNNAENFFYIDYNGGSPTLNVDTTQADVNQRDKVGIGRVYREGSHLHILSAGLNADELGRRIQSRFNNVDGSIVRASGLMISETGTRNLAVTAGQVYAGLTPHSIKATDTSAGDTFVYYYRDGGTGWTTTSGNTQIDNQHYDDGSGTLANLNPNRYGVHWVYVDYGGGEHVVYGRGNYTESEALNAQPPSPLPGLITDFSFLVGKIIIQQAASSFYDTESAFNVVLSNAGVSLHNSLSDIQGGTTDEYYHLTSTMYNTLTSNGGVDDASTEHIHDDRYYTESEVDTISGSITSQISNSITTEYIKLNPEPSNNDFSGTIVSSSVSGPTFFGQALYLDSDGTYKLANSTDSSAMPCVALSTISGTGTYDILFQGFARNDDWNWTPGGPIFVDSTDGELTQITVSGSGNIVQAVGFATHADRMFFNPDYTTATVA